MHSPEGGDVVAIVRRRNETGWCYRPGDSDVGQRCEVVGESFECCQPRPHVGEARLPKDTDIEISAIWEQGPDEVQVFEGGADVRTSKYGGLGGKCGWPFAQFGEVTVPEEVCWGLQNDDG